VKSVTTSDQTYYNTSTWTDISALQLKITPKKANSKIIISGTVNIGGGPGDSRWTGLRLQRNGTDLSSGATLASGGTPCFVAAQINDTFMDYMVVPIPINFVDTPASISEQTYTIAILTNLGGSGSARSAYLNRCDRSGDDYYRPVTVSTLTVMEVDSDDITITEGSKGSDTQTSAFRVTMSTTEYSAPVDAQFVVPFDTKVYDTTNEFNTTTHRFQPTQAGYYMFTGWAEFSTDSGICALITYKNTSRSGNSGAVTTSNGTFGVSISDQMYLNGTTDYVELKAFSRNGGIMYGGNDSSIVFTGIKVDNPAVSSSSTGSSGSTVSNETAYCTYYITASNNSTQGPWGANGLAYMQAPHNITVSSDGKFTIQIAGVYTVNWNWAINSGGYNAIQLNGVGYCYSGNNNNNNINCSMYCSVGDVITPFKCTGDDAGGLYGLAGVGDTPLSTISIALDERATWRASNTSLSYGTASILTAGYGANIVAITSTQLSSNFTLASNTFTCTVAGLYDCSVNGMFYIHSWDFEAGFAIYKNGSEVIHNSNMMRGSGNLNPMSCHVQGYVELAVNDTLSFYALNANNDLNARYSLKLV
jgi:hypothetical protein